VPRLRDEADAVRFGREKRLEAGIVRDRAAGALYHAEGREAGVREAGLGREERGVGVVGARVAAFDVVEAEPVEQRRDAALVLDRKVDARRLRAVAQRGVEQVEAFLRHLRLACWLRDGIFRGLLVLG